MLVLFAFALSLSYLLLMCISKKIVKVLTQCETLHCKVLF